MSDPELPAVPPQSPGIDPAPLSPIDRWIDWWSERPMWALLLAALLALPQINPWFWPDFDAHSFLSIARSVWDEGPLSRFGSVQLYFIPGYSVLISPAFLIDDRPFLVISLIQYALLLTFAAGVYAWACALFDKKLALVLAAIVTFNPSTWLLFRPVTSEAAFMPGIVWSAYLLNRVLTMDRDAPLRRALLMAAAASLLVVVTTTMRYPGVFLAAGFGGAVMFNAWRGRYRWMRAVAVALVVGLPPVAAAGGFILHDRSLAQAPQDADAAPTYTEQLLAEDQSLAGQLAEGVRLRVSEVGRLMVPGLFKTYGRAGDWTNPIVFLYALLAVPVGWGIVLLARTGRDALAWSAPLYVLLYIIWPWDAGIRFMAPLQPVLWAGALQLLLSWRPRARLTPALAVLAALHLIVAWGHLASKYPRIVEINQSWATIDAGMAITGADVHDIVTLDLPPMPRNMVLTAYDRRPRNVSEVTALPEDARWIFAPAEAEAPVGFTRVLGDERLALWEAPPAD